MINFTIKNILQFYTSMPYNNNYNENIARRVRAIDKRHIDRINQISETNNFDIATPLESMT